MDATLLGQKGPTGTYTYPNPNQYFILKMLIISFIFIENKCLSDAIWDLKKGEKKLAKRRIRTRVERVKKSATHALSSVPLQSPSVSVFCNLHQPNPTLVGRVSGNSLCHQSFNILLVVRILAVQN